MSVNQKMIDQVMSQAYGQHQAGNLPQAKQGYLQVLQWNPTHPDANRLLGVIAFQNGLPEQALQFIQVAASAAPKFAQNYVLLGSIYQQLNNLESAIVAYKKAIKLQPDYLEALNNLGLIYKQKKLFTDAISCFKNALRHQNKSAYTWSNLGNTLKEVGLMKEAIEALSKAFEVDPHFSAAYSNYCMALNYSLEFTPDFVFQKHKEWEQHCPPSIQAKRFDFSKRKPKKRLRIAYISPDLHTHSVAYFIEPLLKTHDKNQFEVYAYYNNSVFDQTTERLKSCVDQWRDIAKLSTLAVAELIYKDEIDILIDLTGHSANNTLAILHQKPAPVQVTWLGYPNTTGLSSIDYRISDQIADPAGEVEHFHSEQVVRLPNGFLCYQGDQTLALPDKIPYDHNGYFTLGSFNNYVKITPEVIKVWSAILTALPSARLILKSSQFGDRETKGRCIKLFKQNGISKERLNLVAMLPKASDHMQFYNELDLALDPFPYNGTTTTFEAMWMGVPTLTLAGDVHASRVGASILTRVGLKDFICDSEKAYIEKAVALAAELDTLRTLRSSLRDKMLSSPLCDRQQFARDMEAAYMEMWETYLATDH